MAGPLTNKRFSEFPEISAESLEVLNRLGFDFATPVQAAAVPLFAANKDVAVDACTGSGKTLAFVLPLVEKLRKLEPPLKKHHVGAVVISPTRELARQIFEVAQPFVESVPNLTARQYVGGTDIHSDIAEFVQGGGNVLVGTPGRIGDMLQRCRDMEVRTVEVLVLDEADRLLDMGFQMTLLDIIGRLPKQRRTGLFSATQAEAVEALVKAGMRNPVRINVSTAQQGSGRCKEASGETAQKTPTSLNVEYVVCDFEQKLGQMVDFISQHRGEKLIVYFLTCACVDFFFVVMRKMPQMQKMLIKSLHGKMKQSAREKALKKFSEEESGVLLATDVAARGLDIPDINWVVQFDAPQDPSAFVHRVGRTARMGKAGNARIYLTPHEKPYVEFLSLRKIPIQEIQAQENVPQMRDWLRDQAENDREVMLKGIRSFVSYVRGYSNHHCPYIFRLDDLDFVALAYTSALLRFPKMPEIRKCGKNLSGFKQSDIDPDTVKFKEKCREKQRLQILEKRKQDGEESKTLNTKLREKRKQGNDTEQRKGEEKKRRRCKNVFKRDVAELDDDYALLKKLKKGQITELDFEKAMGVDLGDDDLIGHVKCSEDGGDVGVKEGKKNDYVNRKIGYKKNGQRRKKRGVNKKLREKLL